MAPLPREGITPGMEEEMKEWLERYRPVRQRTARRQQMMKQGPCRLLSTLFQPTGNESEEELPFPEEIDIIRSANSVPQPVVSI